VDGQGVKADAAGVKKSKSGWKARKLSNADQFNLGASCSSLPGH
jgi:hypothetical protein